MTEQNTTKAGCFDGIRGLYLTMSIDDAESASHQGQCDEDVKELTESPEISSQLDAIGADAIRAALKECGSWDDVELADDGQNRLRATWIAACDLRENASEQLTGA